MHLSVPRLLAAGAAAVAMTATSAIGAAAATPAGSPVYSAAQTLVQNTVLTGSHLFGSKVVAMPDAGSYADGAAAVWTDLTGTVHAVEHTASDDTWNQAYTVATNADALTQPAVAVSPTGQLAVAYVAVENLHRVVDVAVMAADGSWQAPVTVSDVNADLGVTDPVLAFADNGNLAVAFDSLTDIVVQTLDSSDLSVVSSPVDVPVALSDVPVTVAPVIVIDPDGTTVDVLYDSVTGGVAVASVANGALAGADVLGSGVTASSINLANQGGTLVATWLSTAGMQFATFSGTSWTTAQNIGGSTVVGPSQSTVLSTANNTLSALWITGVTGGGQQILSSVYSGGTWSDPVTVVTSTGGQTISNLTGGADSTGIPTMAYSLCSGNQNCSVFYSTLQKTGGGTGSGGTFPTPSGIPDLTNILLGNFGYGGMPGGGFVIVYNIYNNVTKDQTALKSLTASPLKNTAAPYITGSRIAGQRLTAHEGSWSITPTSYSYQWYLGSTAISGATAKTYTPKLSMGRKYVTVKVTAHVAVVSGTATAARQQIRRPHIRNTVLPSISGTRSVHHYLVVHQGRWSPKPGKVTYRWRRDGKIVPHATSYRYKLSTKDRHHRISVTVTAYRTYFVPQPATSKRTATIR